ncbi:MULTISPECIES: hypothetical protein [Aquimarina]|uniref:DoxX family membrane protein n=1 Tax=Aquimarina algiphila TaxID=2047982 RepID=A0A554VBE6_9FLAO|nr:MULTISPECIES: hypothetical protein [Aquimarina]TSE03834.1 hypothetical protein FOF46_28270 [Aquimarina algiphila]
MKHKIFIYHVIRVAFGMFLVLYSIYNVIKYSEFLERLDRYFSNVTVFDTTIIESLAPLVPFEEFIIGFFITLGIFTRKALMAAIILFGFFALFLLDANYINCATVHLLFSLLAILLLKKDNYDLNTVNFDKDSHQIIQ